MENKKKILYVVEAMGGGVFTYVVDLANALVNEYEVYLAYAIRPQTPDNYKEYFDSRIHLIHVKNFCREINLKKDIESVKEIKRIAKKINPDIIHLHSSKAGIIGRIAFNGKKVPLFYTPHGYSFLMEDYKPVKRLMFKSIEWLFAKRKCTTISCSEGEHKETLKLTKRATYVNNAVNIEKLEEDLKNTGKNEEHPFTVFTLGRICYQKNPKLFNEIAEALPDVQFLWIGEGELREELKSPNIKITGWVERKIALMQSLSAEAFILTSLWEGLPMSLLEAMYMQKPCVVSNVIGNRDVIHNNENGYVCENIEQFVQAIKDIRDGKSQKYIKKAYQDILDYYNTKVQAEHYSNIYMDCNIQGEDR